MNICPECKKKIGKNAYITDSQFSCYEYPIICCPICGCELEDLLTYEENEKSNEQEDKAEDIALEDRNDTT